jgi:hypothetical protein
MPLDDTVGETGSGKVAEEFLLTKFSDFSIVYPVCVDFLWRIPK